MSEPGPMWTTVRGRVLSCTAGGVGVALAWAIKWGGLRDPGVVAWAPAQALLGWAPSLLVAFALAFAWPAMRRRVLGRPTRVDFLPECVAGAVIVLLGEASDLLLPQVGDTAPQTFDVADALAAPAGAAAAFAVCNTTIRLETFEGKDQCERCLESLL